MSSEDVSGALIGMNLLKHQQFDAAFGGMIKSGNAVYVGEPLTSQPQLRGGFESPESLARARKFLQRQVIISSLSCAHGTLRILCKDGRTIDVCPEDAVVFCTGQRAENAGESSYKTRSQLNKNGLFHVYVCHYLSPPLLLPLPVSPLTRPLFFQVHLFECCSNKWSVCALLCTHVSQRHSFCLQ